MKYLKMFEGFIEISGTTGDMNIDNEIFYIARKYGIKKYKINEDRTIDVDGDVDLSKKELTELPLKFRNVTGDFSCSYNQLSSLEGSPRKVGGNFLCYSNQLRSLEESPQSVDGDFFCDNNKLTSLDGCPKTVGGGFYCYKNQLISLDGCPQNVGGDFYCDNNKLTSLDGCPKSVGGDFYCVNNPCYPIYCEWIDTDRREELLDMMKDYDFLRDGVMEYFKIINWYLLESFYKDAGLKIPNKEELQKYYTIED